MLKMDWNLVGFVKASKYIKKVLLALEEGNKTPKEIKNELGFYLSHISQTLKDLMEKNLIVCLTPMLSKGRIYALTELGYEVVKEIKNDLK